MPTVTGQIHDASDNPLAVAIVATRVGQAGRISDTVVSRGVVQDDSDINGDFSLTIGGGTWRLEWYADGLRSEVLLGVPSGGGPYSIDDVAIDPAMTAGETATAILAWFSNVTQMLAADSSSWTIGRTLNTTGSDGVRSAWVKLAKTNPEAAGIAANGDSVLETTDGLAFSLREAVYS